MNKFTRFFVAMVLYIVCWLFLFLVIPSLTLLFGGSFLAVIQHPAYIIAFGVIIINIFLGCIFHDAFDEDFNFQP